MLGCGSHIPLLQRKALSARLMYLDSIREGRSLDKEVQSFYRRLDDQLFTLTDLALNEPSPNSIRLDSFLHIVSNDFGPMAEPLLRTEIGSTVELAVRAFQNRAKAFSCESCTKDGRICNGTVDDDVLVGQDGSGTCIAQMHACAKDTASIVTNLYSKYSALFSKKLPTRIIFSTSFFNNSNPNDKPHDNPIEVYCGGTTTFQDEGDDLLSEIKLVIVVDQFDDLTYLSVPYVLFHEFICHCFQGSLHISGIRSPRADAEPDDAFTEGWMDWVAYKLLIDTLEVKPIAYLPPSDVRDAATLLHSARTDYRNVKPSKHAIERALGREVADRVLYLFERLPESSSTAWDLFVELSFDLNLLRNFSYIREDFVSILELFLLRRGADIYPLTKVGSITEIFRTYLKTKNLNQLINDVMLLGGYSV